jgi:hypothetical protein
MWRLFIYTHMHIIHTCIHSGAVELTYGKQAFDSSETRYIYTHTYTYIHTYIHAQWSCGADLRKASLRLIRNTLHTHTYIHIHTYMHSGAVELTYGKQAFDSSATPVSEDQIPAAAILMFKAPPGAEFLANVDIAIPVDKAVFAMLFGPGGERRNYFTGERRLLIGSDTVQELKQHWFSTDTMVC